MATISKADASPEKRLFIELLTRDIGLEDAFLDLIDNSLNAVLLPVSGRLKSAADYFRFLGGGSTKKNRCKIKIVFDAGKIVVSDDASGISFEAASKSVFRFGRAEHERSVSDRLSVYGIGLKRAFFKMGNKVVMRSEHKSGGFDLLLDVKKWERETQTRWEFEITDREPVKPPATGTKIEVRDLHDAVVRRIDDGVFEEQLRTKISRTYSLYLGKLVDVTVNGKEVSKTEFRLGENYSSDSFEQNKVSCTIAAGIAIPDKDGKYRGGAGGWFIFCNGRNIIYADTKELTGWTGPPNLPQFQPKHRPFLGLVFFFSEDPEDLPWTTTKATVNTDHVAWREAKKRMVVVGKSVTSLLDNRYGDDGTQLTLSELRSVAGSPTSALATTSQGQRSFSAAKSKPPDTVRIQYTALLDQVDQIARHLGKPKMGGSAVGRYTFQYYLRNKVQKDG